MYNGAFFTLVNSQPELILYSPHQSYLGETTEITHAIQERLIKRPCFQRASPKVYILSQFPQYILNAHNIDPHRTSTVACAAPRAKPKTITAERFFFHAQLHHAYQPIGRHLDIRLHGTATRALTALVAVAEILSTQLLYLTAKLGV